MTLIERLILAADTEIKNAKLDIIRYQGLIDRPSKEGNRTKLYKQLSEAQNKLKTAENRREQLLAKIPTKDRLQDRDEIKPAG